jgi:hypothetical protein
MTIREVIHIGDKIHHHDQLMTWVSFRTINTIVNSPTNPTPEFEFDEFDIILIFSY